MGGMIRSEWFDRMEGICMDGMGWGGTRSWGRREVTSMAMLWLWRFFGFGFGPRWMAGPAYQRWRFAAFHLHNGLWRETVGFWLLCRRGAREWLPV